MKNVIIYLCRVSMQVCMKWGWMHLAQDILNWAQRNVLHEPETHFCRYKAECDESGKVCCIKCKRCGKECSTKI